MTSRDAVFESFDGAEIAFGVRAAGDASRPPVLLLHGFIIDSRSWPPALIEAVAATGRAVITPDFRAHGKSSRPTAPLPTDALARDIQALADHLALDSFALLGYSMGSIVAARVAVADARVERAVLGGMGHHLADPSWSRPRELAAAFLGEGGHASADADRYAGFVSQFGGDMVCLGRVQAAQVMTPPEELAQVAVPTLVVAGIDDDENGDPALLASLIPGATLHRTPGDHMTALFDGEFTRAVSEFLSTSPG